jgi:hypothetical protein
MVEAQQLNDNGCPIAAKFGSAVRHTDQYEVGRVM